MENKKIIILILVIIILLGVVGFFFLYKIPKKMMPFSAIKQSEFTTNNGEEKSLKQSPISIDKLLEAIVTSTSIENDTSIQFDERKALLAIQPFVYAYPGYEYDTMEVHIGLTKVEVWNKYLQKYLPLQDLLFGISITAGFSDCSIERSGDLNCDRYSFAMGYTTETDSYHLRKGDEFSVDLELGAIPEQIKDKANELLKPYNRTVPSKSYSGSILTWEKDVSYSRYFQSYNKYIPFNTGESLVEEGSIYLSNRTSGDCGELCITSSQFFLIDIINNKVIELPDHK